MVFVSAAPCILAIITIIINGNTTVGSKKTFISCKEDNTPQKWCALPNSGSLGLRSVANDNKFECLYTLQCRYTYIYDNKFRTFAHTLNIIVGLFGLNIVLLHTAPHNCNYYYYADFFFHNRNCQARTVESSPFTTYYYCSIDNVSMFHLVIIRSVLISPTAFVLVGIDLNNIITYCESFGTIFARELL